MSMKQLRFKNKEFEMPRSEFGGSLLNGNNAKTKRPVTSKYPIHVVVRGVKGGMRNPKAFKAINTIIDQAARKTGTKIYKRANVGNHLHLVLKLHSIDNWAGFIREITGRIGLKMYKLGLTKKGENYWRHKPFTRVVKGWGNAFISIKKYIYLNQLEADGFVNRRETRTYRDLAAIWGSS